LSSRRRHTRSKRDWSSDVCSSDLGRVRELLDSLGATGTRITATGDLDEHRVEGLRDTPLDGYGIGTRLVTGGGHPAPGFVYKLVEREGADGSMQPVGKRSTGKATLGAGKAAYRMRGGERAQSVLALSGEEEVAEYDRELIAELTSGESNPDWKRTSLRPLQQPLIVGGELLESRRPPARVEAARARHAASVAELGLSPED